MIIISSRKDFWSSFELSDSDEVRDVVLTDDSLGTPMSEAQLLAAIQDQRVLILIHGYNNEEDDVVRSYHIIEQNLIARGFVGPGRPYDLILGYTWPGGMVLSYHAAKARAGAVGPRMTRWLTKMSQSASAIDINTHSLGARVALIALQPFPNGPQIRYLFTLAAAVDNESIEWGEKFFNASQACRRLYAFHSKNDPVLKLLYPVGDFDLALGYSGPEDPGSILAHSTNVRVVNCKKVIHQHGGYKYSDPVYRFMLNEYGPTPAGQFTTL